MATMTHGLRSDPTERDLPGIFPNSQDSSFADSVNSQPSQVPPLSTGFLEDSHVNPGIDAATPSTPLSIYSSQDVATDSLNVFDHNTDEHVRSAQKAPSKHNLLVHTDGLVINTSQKSNVALKRTANGDLKSPYYSDVSASLPESPAKSHIYGHSRTTSTASRNSQIGELSNELRTRLSYAMVKVQHGWESHNLAELENIKSSRISPVSTHSPKERVHDMSSIRSSPTKRPLSAHSAGDVSSFLLISARPRNRDRRDGGTYTSVPSSATNPPKEGFDSFLRGRSASINNSTSRTSEPYTPSLGPPVDILPGNVRALAMTQNVHHQTSPVSNANSRSEKHKVSDSSLLSSPVPTTPLSTSRPQRAPLAKMRTPSQQAAVEKDAVETLLFMSSPGNSQKYTSQHVLNPVNTQLSSPQENSPVNDKSSLTATLHSTMFTNVASTSTNSMDTTPVKSRSHNSSGPFAPTMFERRHHKPPLSDQDINKILDEMPDSDDSSQAGDE